MPVSFKLLNEWKDRLAESMKRSRLHSQDAWRDGIRVQVLQYFISRYGNETFAHSDHVGPRTSETLMLPRRIRHSVYVQSRAQMHGQLWSIHEVNERLRARLR